MKLFRNISKISGKYVSLQIVQYISFILILSELGILTLISGFESIPQKYVEEM